MGVEIHVPPSAVSRTVTGAYVSPEQARVNRLVRKFRKATDEEVTEAAHKVPITDEGRAALQVMKERGEAAAKDEQKAAELAKEATDWLEKAKPKMAQIAYAHLKQSYSTHLKPGMVTVNMGTIDPKVYSLIVGESPSKVWLDEYESFTQVVKPDPHPKYKEPEGDRVAELVLKVGPHTINLGAAVAVQQETVVSPQPEIFSVSALTDPNVKIPMPKYHAKMTFEMKDWSEVLKALGWKPTCGNHAAGCHDWTHYEPKQ